MPARPLPNPTSETLPFWQACAQGRLVFQRCAACGHAQFPPRARCLDCDAPGPEWCESARVGTVHTFTVVERAPSAAFRGDLPYAIALIDLDEGVRMMMNVRGPLDGLVIGRRVRVSLEPNDGPWPLPQAVLLGDTLTFASLEPGRSFGTHADVAGSGLLARWAALHPADATPPGGTPAGLANVLVMRAYLALVQPRPPGNVHAGMWLRRIAPIPAGAWVRTTIACTGRQERSGRRFVEFSARACIDDDAPVIDARLRLAWAC